MKNIIIVRSSAKKSSFCLDREIMKVSEDNMNKGLL